MSNDVHGYRGYGVRVHLAGALLAAERWLAVVGLEDPGITELVDHLWQWPAVDRTTFREWDRWSSPTLEVGLGGDMQTSLAIAAERCGATDTLPKLLRAVTEIVYAHLYGAVDVDGALCRLAEVAAIVSSVGIRLVDPAEFGVDPSASHDSWGPTIDVRELNRCRSLG